MNDKYPFVTLLIVVRNEITYISRSLKSLLEQDYPVERTEIIVVDGMSEDNTREYLYNEKKKCPKIRVIDNPEKSLADGWNIGIKAASGDLVCRIDAHSTLERNYVKLGVQQLIKFQQDNVVGVGGVLQNNGMGNWSKTFVSLFSSKFGVGNSPFRNIQSQPIFSDTAVFAVYWKWIFKKAGYFDESLDRNQDIALHRNIQNLGYKFLTDPSMKATYYVRSSLPKLLKKAYTDGYWTAYSGAYYIRHLVPCFFVVYLCFWFVGLILLPYPFTLVISIPFVMYWIFAFFFAFKDGQSFVAKLFLPPLFFLYHTSYGIGSLHGFFKR